MLDLGCSWTVGVFSDLEVLDSKRSRKAKTLDSLTEDGRRVTDCEAEEAEGTLLSGVADFAFLENFLSKGRETLTDLRDLPIEEAVVLVDFRDKVSDVGEDSPEDDSD